MPISIAALKEQTREVLNPKYRDTHLARVFALSDDAIKEVVSPVLYTPPSTPFVTADGRMVDIPIIPTSGKIGKLDS